MANNLVQYSHYPSTLAQVKPGKPFWMLNYENLFMRLKFTNHSMRCFSLVGQPVKLTLPLSFTEDSNEMMAIPNNRIHHPDDLGEHYPVVNFTTGEVMWMHKDKPIRIT